MSSPSRRAAAMATVGGDGRRRAPQQDGVARLEAQAGGVAGHVGAVLVDDPDHAERDPHPLTRSPLGRTQPSTISPTGSGRAATVRRPAAMAATRPRSRRSRSREVASAPARSARATSAALAVEDAGRPAAPAGRRPGEGLVPGGRGGPGQQPAGGLGAPAQLDHGGGWARWHRVSVLPGTARPRRPGAAVAGPSPAPPGRPGGPPRGRRRRAARPTAGRPTRPTRRPSLAHQALGEDRAVGTGDLHGVVDVELAPGRDHPGRQQRPALARPGPAGPRRRPRWCPTPPRRRRSTACGPGRRRSRGRKRVPTPGADPGTAASTPGREASAMTASTPDHTAILAAASFEPIPPLPTAVPGPPAMRSSSWSISTTSSMREPAVGPAGVLGEQSGGVGQQHQQLGPDQVGHQGGQPVVVAEPDLLVGHGVVLVDHRAPRPAPAAGRGSGGRGGTGSGARSRAGPAGPGRR